MHDDPARLTQAADLILADQERRRWGASPAPRPASFSNDELVEAFEFLRRTGIIEKDPPWTGPSPRP